VTFGATGLVTTWMLAERERCWTALWSEEKSACVSTRAPSRAGTRTSLAASGWTLASTGAT
jgi:hypothetical protein